MRVSLWFKTPRKSRQRRVTFARQLVAVLFPIRRMKTATRPQEAARYRRGELVQRVRSLARRPCDVTIAAASPQSAGWRTAERARANSKTTDRGKKKPTEKRRECRLRFPYAAWTLRANGDERTAVVSASLTRDGGRLSTHFRSERAAGAPCCTEGQTFTLPPP